MIAVELSVLTNAKTNVYILLWSGGERRCSGTSSVLERRGPGALSVHVSVGPSMIGDGVDDWCEWGNENCGEYVT